MSGSAGGGEVPFALTDFTTSAGASSTLTLVNTLSFNANDLILIADQNDTAMGLAPCMIEQVATSFTGGATQALSLSGGPYYMASIAGANIVDIRRDSGQVLNLGNVANANLPNFLVIGVGDDNTLYSYDLLQSPGTSTSLPVADGVFELQALYGVDNDNNGTIDDWIDPSTAGAYSLNALTAGTKAAATQLQRIKAVRVGLIMRSALPEKEDVAPETITLFSDLSGFSASPYVRSLLTSGAINERKYRYRTIESTIPLRNPMM